MIKELGDLPAGVIGFEASGNPGEVKVFRLEQRDEAIAWAAGGPGV